MAQAKWDRQVGKESVEDNFDEMLKVFEGYAVLQGQDMWIYSQCKFFYIYALCLLYSFTLP